MPGQLVVAEPPACTLCLLSVKEVVRSICSEGPVASLASRHLLLQQFAIYQGHPGHSEMPVITNLCAIPTITISLLYKQLYKLWSKNHVVEVMQAVEKKYQLWVQHPHKDMPCLRDRQKYFCLRLSRVVLFV